MAVLSRSQGSTQALPVQDHSVWVRVILVSIVIAGLAFLGYSHFLLFHAIAELSTVVVSCLAFVVAIGTYRFTHNGYLLVIGCGYLWVAFFDFGHTLLYKGMGIIDGNDANVATQLWLCARFVEMMALLAAPVGLRPESPLRFGPVFAAFSWLALALGLAVWTQMMPAAYVEGHGLTVFKVVSEHVLVVGYVVSGVVLIRKRALFPANMWGALLGALLLTVLTELIFTAYVTVTGPLNILGHLTKIVSFWLVFEAAIGVMLTQPFDVLARTVNSFEVIPQPVLLVSQEGLVMQANGAALSWFERAPEEIIGQPVRTLFHQAPLARSIGSTGEIPLQRAIRTLKPIQDTVVLSAEHGKSAQVSMSILTAGQSQSNDGIMVLCLRDVSEREQAKQRALISEQRLTVVLETNELGLWDWDVVTGDVFFSPLIETGLGYAVGEWPRSVRAWEKRLHPSDRPQVMKDLHAHLEGKSPLYDNTHRILHKEGHWVWVHDRGQVIERDSAGRALRAIGTHALVTPPAEAEGDTA